MFNKKIIFCATNKDMVDIWPHPQPASKFIPEEYKKFPRFHKKNKYVPTVKVCMPFLDSLTAGYIIPFDQDYFIDPLEGDFSVVPANREADGAGFHDKIQLPPEWKEKIGGNCTGKFMNKWLIKTPPGYSCLFIHPMNRYKEDRFKIIEGIVDTDTYCTEINFPFILKKRDTDFLLKKGEAMVQVIPFKRDSWKMWSGFYVEKLHKITNLRLSSEWIDRYKKMFWNKKSFK